MTTSYRPATSDDRPFIVSGWSASQRMTRDIPLVSMASYAELWHRVIAETLERPRLEVIVAHGYVLQGFIAFEPDYVVYVYVAQPFRKQGIARGLFAAAGIDPESRFGFACRTKASWECRSKIPLAYYDPYRARFEERQ